MHICIRHVSFTSGALVVVAAKAGLTPAAHLSHPREVSLEVPFNSARKMAMSIHALPSPNEFAGIKLGQNNNKYTHVAIVKGAPDRVGTGWLGSLALIGPCRCTLSYPNACTLLK